MIAPMGRCRKGRHANKPAGWSGESPGPCRPHIGPPLERMLLHVTGRLADRGGARRVRGHATSLSSQGRGPASALKSVGFSESRPSSCGMKGLIKHARSVTGSLVRIIMPPLFRPSPAPLPCDKSSLRWPGPFGSGFLSPQPPGIVGIGPIAGSLTGPTRVGPFLFCRRHFAYAIRAVARKQQPAVAKRRSKLRIFRRCQCSVV